MNIISIYGINIAKPNISKKLVNKIPLGKKYALAGSISENNIENLSKLGVNFFDLSSSLESQLGYKDHHKIKSFINKINELKN